MFFCGDIALPFKGAISLNNFPATFSKSVWVGNLEGTLLDSFACKEQSKGVFNSIEAIKGILTEIPFKAFVLANNHLLDAGDYVGTAYNLDRLGVKYVGAGRNSAEASKYIDVVDIDGTTYRIVAFGWDCIECVYATKSKQGVNPYTKKHVLRNVEQALSNDVRLICFFHWDYELELYPQPYDRQIAHELIDMGVYAVIGCHAHRTQQIEMYKGHPIVYGLGNFLFRQGFYFGGKLKYPEFCNEEWVFEIKGGDFFLHRFSANPSDNELAYKSKEQIVVDEPSSCRAKYEEFALSDYDRFFRNNRVQKKLLPIFRSNESIWRYSLKSNLVKWRGSLLNLVVQANLKSGDRSKRSS